MLGWLVALGVLVCVACDAAQQETPARQQLAQTPATGMEEAASDAEKSGRPAIVGAVMHGKEAGGKMFEVLLDRPFGRRDTAYYKFHFVTKTGKELEDTGMFISNGVVGVNETRSVKQNVFLFVRRHDGDERREVVSEHLNPGNIESVTIKLSDGRGGFKEADVFAQGTFKDL